MLNERDVTIDILKALGIILIVVGHSGFLYSDFLTLFHVAVFFIASGYCTNLEKYSINNRELYKYVVKKIKGYWLPFFLFNFVMTLLHNYLLNINVYTDNPEFLIICEDTSLNVLLDKYSIGDILIRFVKLLFFCGESRMGGATWFLRTLFIVSIIVVFYCYFIRLLRIKFLSLMLWVLGVVSLFVGWLCQIKEINLKLGFNSVLISLIAFIFGYSLGELNRKSKISVPISVYVCMFIISFIFLIVIDIVIGDDSIAIATGYIINPFVYIVASILGWILLYSLSIILSRIEIIKNVLVYIGNRTIIILLFHFLAFKLVILVEIIIKKLPMVLLASFPVLERYGNSCWWVVYSVTGVILPLLISYFGEKIVNLIRKLSL